MKPLLLFLLVSSQAFGQARIHKDGVWLSGKKDSLTLSDTWLQIGIVRSFYVGDSTGLVIDTTTKPKGMDTAYWSHITKHERFKFVKADTTVTGIVTKIFTERDGDLHVILKQKNKILRCEIICYQRVNEACNGFWNHTKRPKIGSRVSVTGDYVYDRWHHWHEIHPCKVIKVI